MYLPKDLRSDYLLKRLERSYFNHGKIHSDVTIIINKIIPKLLTAFIRMDAQSVIYMHLFSILYGTSRISSPVILKLLLESFYSSSKNSSYVYAGLLITANIVQLFVHHILFYITMKIGWSWKAATSALIYKKLFRYSNIAQPSTSNHANISNHNTSTSTGNLVNLISNDVSFNNSLIVFDKIFLAFAILSSSL